VSGSTVAAPTGEQVEDSLAVVVVAVTGVQLPRAAAVDAARLLRREMLAMAAFADRSGSPPDLSASFDPSWEQPWTPGG
jgi:hypothetical protein